jgi:type I restriction enzyme S subunit
MTVQSVVAANPRTWSKLPIEAFAAPGRDSFVDGPFGSELRVSDLAETGVPLIRIQHVGVAEFREGFDQFVSDSKFRELSRHDARPGDLVFAKLGDPAGRSALVPAFVSRALIVADCVRLRIDSSKIDPVFLSWAVNSPAVLAQISSSLKGSTRQRANLADFKKLLIPVPRDRGLQTAIAARLSAANKLRCMYRYALELSGGLLEAAFLEMFPSREKLDTETVVGLAKRGRNKIRTGPFGSQLLHSEFTKSGVAVLGIDNAVNNRFEWGISRHISMEKYEKLRRYRVYPEDVLITLMGTTGRCAVVPNNIPEAINTKHLCCISLDPSKCLPSYLHGSFLFDSRVRQQLQRATKGSIMDGLNMQIIKELNIPIPGPARQVAYARTALALEQLRRTQCEALRQSEHLFQTLLDEAFGQ